MISELIKQTAEIFKSKYIHIGCDEVDLRTICNKFGLDNDKVWTEYVNKIIEIVYTHKRNPIIWADHLTKPAVLHKIRKDVTVMHWQYESQISDQQIIILKQQFQTVIVSPSLSCWDYILYPSAQAVKNTALMCKTLFQNDLDGIINTLWCPYRYLQAITFYSIAIHTHIFKKIKKNKKIDLQQFFIKYCKEEFEIANINILKKLFAFLKIAEINRFITTSISSGDYKTLNKKHQKSLLKINKEGKDLIPEIFKISPLRNIETWNALVISAAYAWQCSEHFRLLTNNVQVKSQVVKHNKMTLELKNQILNIWDNARFSDNRQKHFPLFVNSEKEYVHLLLNKLFINKTMCSD